MSKNWPEIYKINLEVLKEIDPNTYDSDTFQRETHEEVETIYVTRHPVAQNQYEKRLLNLNPVHCLELKDQFKRMGYDLAWIYREVRTSIMIPKIDYDVHIIEYDWEIGNSTTYIYADWRTNPPFGFMEKKWKPNNYSQNFGDNYTLINGNDKEELIFRNYLKANSEEAIEKRIKEYRQLGRERLAKNLEITDISLSKENVKDDISKMLGL